MNKRANILFAALVVIFIAGTTYERIQSKADRTDLLNRLQFVGAERIERIVLSPYQTSSENWKIVLSENADVKAIEEGIRNADTRSVMGHSWSIGEWTISLVTQSGKEYTFLAEVFNHQQTDLFLSDSFYIERETGQWSRSGMRRICLPDTAFWILSKAPQGKVESS